MQILVSGSSGLIGNNLVSFLRMEGHTVKRLLRKESTSTSNNAMKWDPKTGEIDLEELGSFDAVINLAGENIASGRWTEEKKERILKSRVETARKLTEAIAKLDKPPGIFINASAVGYYGDQGEAPVTEETPAGEGFLAEVCKLWEEALAPLKGKGIRVVRLRIGVVMTTKGGALERMLTPFKLGMGGVIGSGKQYVSWIALDDLLNAIHHVLQTPIEGAVNAVSPLSVTNRQLTKALGKVLSRPTVLPMPASLARLAFGEFADEALLVSCRAQPTKLQESGYVFLFPEIEDALKHLIG